MGNLHAQITDYLLTQSWQIAALTVAVAAVSLAVRNKNAHVRYLLWLIVLGKCLVPPLLTVSLAVLPEKEVIEPVVTTPVEIPVVEAEVVDVVPFEPVTLPPVPVVVQPAAKPSIAERLAEVTVRQWLALAWVVGVAVFVLAAVLKALRVNRWLRRERKTLPDELQVAVGNSFGDLGVKAVPRVWLVEGIGQPFVWGLVRGSIYLPANFVGVEGDENRRGVLGHELSHILRFDAAVNLLQIIAQAIFWFHPFVWWANRKIRAEREKCCDEMAIARLGARAKDYSSAIVNTLIVEHEAALPIPSLAVAGPVKNIEDRIKTIMRPGKRFYRRPSLVAAITVLVLALIAVPTTLALTRRAAAISDKQARKDSESAESDSNTPAGGYWWSYRSARPSSGKPRKSGYIRDYSGGARYGYGRGGPSVPPGVSEAPKTITCSGTLYDGQGRPLAQAVVTLYGLEIEHETNNRTVLRREETKTTAGGKYSFTTKVPTPRDGTYPMGLIVTEKEGMELEWGNWDLQDNIEIDFIVKEKEKFPKAGPVELSTKEVVERIYASERKIRSLEMQLDSRVTRGESSSLDWGYENGKEYVHSLSDRPLRWGKGVPKNKLREKKAYDGEKSYSLFYSDEIDHKSGYINLVKNNRTTLNVLTPLHFLGCQLFWDDRRTLGEVLRETAEVSVRPEIEVINGHPCAVIEAVGVEQLILRRRPSGEGFEDAIRKWNVRVWIDLERDYRPLRIDKYQTNPEDRWWCLRDRYHQIQLKKVEGIWLPTEGRSERFYARYKLPPKSMDVQQWQQMPYAKRKELSIPIPVAQGGGPVPFGPGPEIIRVDENTVRINKGIAAEKFVVEFPAGTRLQDQVKDITYTVGGFDDPTYEPKTPAEKVLKQLRDREVKVDPKLKGDFIAVLRDFEVFDDSEKWMAAVRALYLIGRPTVPDLIAELERTKNPKTQSAIALTLRAIGDPRAIPALIDALARTEPMSDCGLGEPKYDLHRFIMKHQKDLSDPKLDFGRPVREVTETLERLTGHSEGHKHFSIFDENGRRLSVFDRSPEVVELRKKIRAEAAECWRQWWQKNKQSFLKEKRDSKVDSNLKMDVETLLAKMRESTRPGETMRVHWSRGYRAMKPVPSGRIDWLVKDCTALISGNRSRVDWLSKRYRKKTDRRYYSFDKRTSVFDGSEWRLLLEGTIGNDYGMVSARHNNDASLLVNMHGVPSALHDLLSYKEIGIRDRFELRVADSPKPGVYTLDAFISAKEGPEETRGQHWRLTIDGNRGFNNVRAILVSYDDPESILVEINTTLREYAKGVWYPAEVKRIDYSKDKTQNIEIEAEFDVEVPEDAFKLEFPEGTVVDVVDAEVTKSFGEKKPGEMDVETLLAKIQQAQTPTENMVMEWESEIFIPVPAKRKYKAFISSNRARFEHIQESYKRRMGGEPYDIRQRIYVFDGTHERTLDRAIKQKYPIRPLKGRVRKDTYLRFMHFLRREAFGCGLPLDVAELRKTFNKMEVHDSNTPGIYLLDIIRPNGERHRRTVDGNRGYHIVKRESFDWDKAGNRKSAEINVSLKKRSDGLWYPISWEAIVFEDGKELVVERATIKSVELNAKIAEETFSLELPPGTAIWDDKLEEYVATSVPGTIDLLTLLAKMRKAIRPAENMRVHWGKGEMASPSGVMWVPSNLVWNVKDCTAQISGSRSRVDWAKRLYREKGDETPFYIKRITRVFDGHERRELTEEVEGGRTTYSGTISARHNNDAWLLAAMHGVPHELSHVVDYKEAADGIDLKVTGSPKPGVYTLDAFVYWKGVLEKTGGQRWRLTIDGNKGFNHVKSVLYGDNKSILKETNMTLREYAGGIWYPSRGERVEYSGDKIKRRFVVDIKAEFDVEVPEDAFKLEFPRGAKVKDLLTGKEVVIGEGGEQELERRFESAKKLRELGRALSMYANDEQGRLPDTLEELHKGDYVSEDDLRWLLDNVEYLGKGKKATDAPTIAIAYDRSLFEKIKWTTCVLFLDGHVALRRTEGLEELGIRSQRSESGEKLQELGRALHTYTTDDKEGRLPDSLPQLRGYAAEKDLEWFLENVEYLGKGKRAFVKITDDASAVIAFDKTLLQKGEGTTILFMGGMSIFRMPEELEKLGIRASGD